MKTMEQRIEELRRRRAEIEEGGGTARIEKHHKSGKLTARERITELCDPYSFQESGLFAEHRSTLFGMEGKAFPADGVITGAGTVLGRRVHLASQRFRGRSSFAEGGGDNAAVAENRHSVRVH
jgi:methylmalonyl-CoA carboxyltransferase large subunit